MGVHRWGNLRMEVGGSSRCRVQGPEDRGFNPNGRRFQGVQCPGALGGRDAG